MEKDTEILEQELNELNEMVEEYYRSVEFQQYLEGLETSFDNLNIEL